MPLPRRQDRAFDEAGQPLTDAVGELVCCAPMPSMPLCILNDKDNLRYVDSYFDTYPGHLAPRRWLRITRRGGAIIYGCSDATINRHGIRMGTQRALPGGRICRRCSTAWWSTWRIPGPESYYMPLFVVLRPGEALTAELTKTIRERSARSPCRPATCRTTSSRSRPSRAR